jgi:hypothetical protein
MTFSSRIFKIGINPVVNVPQRVLKELFKQAGKTRGPIPVKGKLNGKAFTQTVVKFQGAWRLYLNTPMRKAAGIDEGDMAHVEINFDSKPRLTPMHPQLKALLSKNKKAKQVFEKLSPYRQKEISRYLNNLKSEESVKKNMEKVIAHLLGKGRFVGRDLVTNSE